MENYAARPQVEADENRVVAETKARELRKGVKMDMADKAQIWK